jgi:hypothetical protein
LTILIVIYGPFCIVIGEKVASFFCYWYFWKKHTDFYFLKLWLKYACTVVVVRSYLKEKEGWWILPVCIFLTSATVNFPTYFSHAIRTNPVTT